jgi:hypothetical protein
LVSGSAALACSSAVSHFRNEVTRHGFAALPSLVEFGVRVPVARAIAKT